MLDRIISNLHNQPPRTEAVRVTHAEPVIHQ